jgi:hypothetical protein
MASKTATPTLHDLAGEIQRATAKARAELDDVRRRLADLRSEREAILNKPLAACDLLPELERHMRIKAREAVDYLRETLAEMRNRTAGHVTVSPDTVASFAPLDKARLPEAIAVLIDPADAARRLLAAAGELPGDPEGLPLEQRRKVVADLDQKIQAAESHEAELVAGLQAAGIKLPMPNDPIPEPRPGDEKTIAGDLHRWVSYTGIPGTYGWMPVAEIEQRAA